MRIGKQAEEQESGRRIDLQEALETVSCSVVVCDIAHSEVSIAFVNAAFSSLTGYAAEEVLGRDLRFMQGPDSDAASLRDVREILSLGSPVAKDFLNYRKSGEPFWNRATLAPIRGDAGKITGLLVVSVDSTADHAHPGFAGQDVQVQRILRNMPGYIYRQVINSNHDLQMSYLSPSVAPFLGEDPERGAGVFFRHIHPDDVEGYFAAVRASAETLAAFKEEFRMVSSEGAVRWVRSEAQAVRHPNGDIVWDGLALDITAEKTSELERSYLSLHDKLTGLANRELFRNRLRQAIDRAGVDESRLGVFIIDLDAFQEVNDSRGQLAGDEVLRQIGRRLQALVDDRFGTVARLGGDEFAVLVPALDQPSALEAIARELCAEVRRPVVIENSALVLEGSLGASVFPPADPSRQFRTSDVGEEIMKQADLALHAAKKEEPGSFRVYETGLDDRFRNRIALRQSLTAAIAERQFELHYQPFVSLVSGEILGAEALVRWRHPTLGFQRPEAFIPLAESSGLIVPLGEWVLGEALRQGESWRRRGLSAGRIAINLSGVQLRRSPQLQRPDFLAIVEKLLADTGADPRGFEFELTEGIIIESSTETLSVLKSLKTLGFKITIDDFGTGHANFRYLRDFVVDKVKIDRSFIARIGEDSETEAIVAAMIRLTRVLGAQVVAEGVESAFQRDFLIEQGCEFGQGYLFSVPVAAEDFSWMLQQRMSFPSLTQRRTTSGRMDQPR
jgi:diguanylate cyclase (GGDEF)-like protein/PAS domain S-box-containing protein